MDEGGLFPEFPTTKFLTILDCNLGPQHVNHCGDGNPLHNGSTTGRWRAAQKQIPPMFPPANNGFSHTTGIHPSG